MSGSGGVNTNTGKVVIGTSVSISSHGFNIPFSTGLFYDNQGGGMSMGFGPNWFSGQLAGLNIIGGSLYYRTGPNRTVQFKQSSTPGSFNASYFVRDTVTKAGSGSSAVYTLLKPDGTRETFDSTGRLASVISPGGVSCVYAYHPTTGQLATVTGTSGGKSWQYVYTWSGSTVTSITYKVDNREVLKVFYGYDSSGRLKTVKKHENSTPGTGTPAWGNPAEASRFSYHASGLLRHVVPPAEYRQMQVNGIDPDTATDSQLNEFAETEYEYGAANRVSKMYTHGRRYTYEFTYTGGTIAGDVFNTWRMKTEVKRPGHVVETFYLNGVGQVILKRFQQKNSGGSVLKTWYPVFQRFQSDGGARITLSATASAINPASFSESKAGLVDLRSNAGLVTEYFYNAQGLIHYRRQRQGTGGTSARLREFTYTQRTVAGLGTIWPVSSEKEFRNANGTGALTTSYAYLWHAGTAALQPSKVTTTYPLVPTTENGTGVAATSEKHFDALGYLTKEVDAVGTATTFEYDRLRDARTVQIQDEGSGRLNLRTDYLPDDQGRTIRELGPEHTIDVGGTAAAIRRAAWTYYKDSIGETWKVRGYRQVSGDSDHTVGSIQIIRRNISGDRPAGKSGWRMDWTVSANYSGSGIPSPTDAFGSLFPRASWDSWKIGLYDKASELREQWTYWQIPSGTGFGTVDVDYGNKRLDYDVAGRQNQTTCAGGTTDRTIYNAMGWPTSEELGVDANPATYTVTKANEYDDDGNLTKVTLPVDSNSANDRVTDYRYDWRDRLEEEETKVQKDSSEGSGEWTLITKYGRDNRGLVTSEAKYHTAVTTDSTTNRIGFRETEYDTQGRLYRIKVFSVEDNGTASNPQETNLHYDGNGRVLKDAPSGSKLFTATEYNAVGWPGIVYQAYDTGTSPTAPPFVTSSTIVLQQTESNYDRAGGRISIVGKQRYDDATATGPLPDSEARVSYLASYPDALGRIQANADYGTNDGVVWNRSATVPPRTGITPVQPRVTSFLYDGLGHTIRETDPAGVHLQTIWDKAGRITETVENWLSTPATDTRTSRFEYTSDSWLRKLISLNPDTGGSGEQVTEWIYGVTKGTGSTNSFVNSKRLVREKIFPDATQPVAYRYNAQLEIFGQTDQLGTVHAYDYDKLGRLVSDAVSAFGPGVNNAVGKISNGFNNRGLLIRSSSHNTVGTMVVNEIAWDYNGFNQPIAEYQEHFGPVDKGTSLKVGYTYADGSANTIRPTGIKYPHVDTGSATTVAIEYSDTMANALSRVDRIKDGSDILSSWRFVGLGMVVAQKYNAASNTELTHGDSSDGFSGYDAFGDVAATLWKNGSTALVQSQYGRNALGDVEWRQDLLADTILSPTTQDNFFWYDRLRQVTRHDRGELTPAGGPPPYTGIAPATRQQQEDLTYDETGNWKGYQTASPVLVQTRTHNVANQITDITNPSGVIDPVYDAAGNMTTMPSPGSWTAGYTCKWDAWDRLVEVSQGGTPVGSYTYDARTRRIRKTTAAETRDYYFDRQWRAIEERVSGAVKADYVYSPFDRWNLIRRRRVTSGSLFNETRFVLRDYLDPVAIITSAGAVDERYGYDAFGPVRFMDSNFGTVSSSGCDWTWLFHGEFDDAETGLYAYGYRYYHPRLGQWISRDPLQEEGGYNLYAFISNDPANSMDILGLKDCGCKADGTGPIEEVTDSRGKKCCPDEIGMGGKNNDEEICGANEEEDDDDGDGGGGGGSCFDRCMKQSGGYGALGVLGIGTVGGGSVPAKGLFGAGVAGGGRSGPTWTTVPSMTASLIGGPRGPLGGLARGLRNFGRRANPVGRMVQAAAGGYAAGVAASCAANCAIDPNFY